MRKTLLVIAAVAGLSTFANAQEITGFTKDNFLVEGSLVSSSFKDKNTINKNSVTSFSPKVGYFLSDKFVIGLNTMIGNSDRTSYEGWSNNEVKIENKVDYLGFGVFGRYYFLEVGNRFKTYAEVNGNYQSIKRKEFRDDVKSNNEKLNHYKLGGSIGANYFLTDKIAINFSFANIISFNTTKSTEKDAKSTNSLDINLNNFNNFFNSYTFGLTFKL